MRFTTAIPPSVKLICHMAKAKKPRPVAPPRAAPTPTKMGERILQFFAPNGITNKAHFAENVLGISRQLFHAWLYKPLADVSAKPLLRCADVLHTNADYLIGESDDPRPALALEYREFQLVEAYRVLKEADQDRLLATAAAWVTDAESAPSTSAPFRIPAK